MNKDRVQGKAKDVAGRVERQAGEWTGNRKMQVKGAARQAEALAASAIETIVALSCNPATFARDAAKLVGGGYRLERVTPVDQFVWTPHLELAAVFRR